jgi:hypothetical protein
MAQEPGTREPVRPSETETELEAIQEKLRRLAEQLASREKLHEEGSQEPDETVEPPA